jgi:hypothetical protein
MKTTVYNKKLTFIFNAFLFLMLLVSQNSLASDNLKIKTKSDMAVFMIEYANEIVSDNVSLSLEDWMLNPNHWEIPAEMNTAIAILHEIDTWMTSPDHFNKINYSNSEIIESWMLNPCHWKLVQSDICEMNYDEKYSEENYLIQDWMKNPYFFQI